MEDIERITNAKNRIFQASMSFGKDSPISMNTDNKHVYRVTGTSQIQDIINSGYVRPRMGKAKGGHQGEVFWTQGSDKLYFYDKRPVLETSVDILKENGQIGAISLDQLTSIWMFDEQQNKYVNNIQMVRNAFNQTHPEQEQTYEDLMKELDEPKKEQVYTEQKSENLMDHDSLVIPGRKYNADGTYTMEYIAHLANTPLGFDQEIFNKLMEENAIKGKQNEAQMTSSSKHM